jgi:hypothetical protein
VLAQLEHVPCHLNASLPLDVAGQVLLWLYALCLGERWIARPILDELLPRRSLIGQARVYRLSNVDGARHPSPEMRTPRSEQRGRTGGGGLGRLRTTKVGRNQACVRPNGLAYDPVHRQILVANVGDPAMPGSHTLTVVAIDEAAARAEIAVAGRTRWAVFDPKAQVFYVNIADPAEIVVSGGGSHTDLNKHQRTIAAVSRVL